MVVESRCSSLLPADCDAMFACAERLTGGGNTTKEALEQPGLSALLALLLVLLGLALGLLLICVILCNRELHQPRYLHQANVLFANMLTLLTFGALVSAILPDISTHTCNGN